MSKLQTTREVGEFLRAKKKYWLGPVVVMLVFLGLVVVLGESSALGPFIYPFF
jgi:hypothetical protein